MNKDQIQDIFPYISLLLGPATPVSESVREKISQIRKMDDYKWITDEYAETIAQEYESFQGIAMEAADVLTAEDHWEPWFHAKKAELDLYYWKRYQASLKGKLPDDVLLKLDSDTDMIVDYLQDPLENQSWDRRGLVMGHVQSGKTGNYTGVICKAADAGYKVIIVIAGLTNNLRKQTQSRIDSGFIGFDTKTQNSARKKYKGVGLINRKKQPASFTTTVSDFQLSAARTLSIPLGALKEPAVIVVKKNSRTLLTLLNYLKTVNSKFGGKIPEPLLIIDDEADNASINIKYGKSEISAINGRIRELMELFQRSCYIGYTATPFANVFIDPDINEDIYGRELFPESFIVSLNPPENYIGPEQIFGDPDTYSGLRVIDDHQNYLPVRHKKDHYVPDIPNSLKKAIGQFVISGAIRMSRGDRNHSSMLINASYLNLVQEQIERLVKNEMLDIQNGLSIYHKSSPNKALIDPKIKSLFDLIKEDYKSASKNISDKEMLSRLHEFALSIQIKIINSQSSEALNYDDYEKTPLNVIAIGGFSLSRGLTLEGLMISYYLRNTAMTDTLLQMGRWFGYRDGYEDLCRIWMRDTSIGDFQDAQVATSELREEFRTLKQSGGTPKDFGLKVSTHMSNLKITSQEKMGKSYILDLSYGGRHVQTGVLSSNSNDLIHNKKLGRDLVHNISAGDITGRFKKSKHGYLAKNVDLGFITGFLAGYKNNPRSADANPANLLAYIEPRSQDELKLWDVLIVDLINEGAGGKDHNLGLTINCSSRGLEPEGDYNYKTDIPFIRRRVGEGGQTEAGLSDKELREAERKFNNDPEKPKKITDRYYRAARKKPLLLIHTIKINDSHFKNLLPVLAWEISFPPTENNDSTKFIVNSIYYENLMEEAKEEDYGDR